MLIDSMDINHMEPWIIPSDSEPVQIVSKYDKRFPWFTHSLHVKMIIICAELQAKTIFIIYYNSTRTLYYSDINEIEKPLLV